MSEHTPGPWDIDWNVSRLDVFGGNGDAATLVATIRRSALSEEIDETAKANARLIAAAPELLEALKAMLEQFNHHTIRGIVHDEFAAIAKAREAIAKAGGNDE